MRTLLSSSLFPLGYRYSVAPAKSFYHSEFELDALFDSGLVRAGPTGVSVVAQGEDYLDPTEVTFPLDEPARHKVVDLLGDLSLLNEGGQGGLPLGHFVAWKADHALQTKFCVELWNRYHGKAGGAFVDYQPPTIELAQPLPPKAPNTKKNWAARDEVAELRAAEAASEEARRRDREEREREPTLDDFNGQR